MGIYSENKIYGIRCKDKDKDDILFEIYFRVFSKIEQTNLADFYTGLISNNNLDNIIFQVYKSYSTSFEFCANRDDMPSYMWINSPLSNINDLLTILK
jgi:hypothetical protein